MFEDIESHELNLSPHSPHAKIIAAVPAGSIVLDVGCNWGYMARELKKKNCRVIGIEIAEQAVARAKEFCEQVLSVDLEQVIKLPFPEKYFDVMIFSDILEHLRRPDTALKNILPFLKPDGRVIASIPNTARFEYRIQFLLGKFDYEPYGGILSRTHLRFFTLKTILELFKESNLVVEKIDYTGLASKLKIFPKLTAFQFLVTAKLTKAA